MAALKEMYGAQNNSPLTALQAPMSEADTAFVVVTGDMLPDAPNILTLGEDEDAEVIFYGEKTQNTLGQCVRGFGGTTAKAWDTGTAVYRAYTAYDHDTFKANIEQLQAEKLDTGGDGAEVTVGFVPAEERANISTGEKLKVLFGKIAKWLGDLGNAAFRNVGKGAGDVAAGDHTHAVADIPTLQDALGTTLEQANAATAQSKAYRDQAGEYAGEAKQDYTTLSTELSEATSELTIDSEVQTIRADAFGGTYTAAGDHVQALDKLVDAKAAYWPREVINPQHPLSTAAGSHMGVVVDEDCVVLHTSDKQPVRRYDMRAGVPRTVVAGGHDRLVSGSVKRYGIRWDRTNAQCTRLWDAASVATVTTNFGHFGSANANYSNPFDILYPWCGRKLCNVDLNAYADIYAAGKDILGAITSWEGEPGFAYDGSNGAVMVYTPAFWAYGERGADYDTYGIADGPLPGWTKVEANIGARYHGSQDGSGGITSVAGTVAWRGTSIRTMLQAAKAQNMTLDDVWTWCADSLLLCVEYATMNTQTAIGNGCASLCVQGATGLEYKPLVAETNANRVIAPVAMQAMAQRPGAALDIGTSNGGLQVASRIVTSVEDYPDDTGYKIINFSGDPVNVLTTHFLSIHGCGNMADEAIGSASGYIGTNGYCNAYYRGRVAFANYWHYVLGAYRQTGTGHIWLAHDRAEAQESETGLDTAKHIDTGLAVPNGTDGAAVGAYLSALHFVEGMPMSPFASEATGGNSTNPVGDYVYTPTLATANTILLAGASASAGAYCGRFYGNWGLSPTTSAWDLAVAPFLLGKIGGDV